MVAFPVYADSSEESSAEQEYRSDFQAARTGLKFEI